MNAIGVNISVNKTFTDACEELLTRSSQTIHELMTELLTSSLHYQGLAKNPVKRQEIRLHCDKLNRCLIAGWTAAIKGQAQAPRGTEEPTTSPRFNSLLDPFISRGFFIAMKQIEVILSKGHHISQQRALREVTAELSNGTQPPAAPNT